MFKKIKASIQRRNKLVIDDLKQKGVFEITPFEKMALWCFAGMVALAYASEFTLFMSFYLIVELAKQDLTKGGTHE